jgi:hypothetical protein
MHETEVAAIRVLSKNRETGQESLKTRLRIVHPGLCQAQPEKTECSPWESPISR